MNALVTRIERARSEGVDISANMYPYEAARNGLVANIPEWAQAGGTDAMLARFHDPVQRARIKSGLWHGGLGVEDRKSTRLNSSHLVISYAVFCLKKKKIQK